MTTPKLNGRIILKKLGNDNFHLYNLDTKDEARINGDLETIFRLSSNGEIVSTIAKDIKQKYPDENLENIISKINESLYSLTQWGFLTENIINGAELIYVDKPNLKNQANLIYLEITKLCNLRCNHCYNKSAPDKELIKDQMNVDQFLNVIAELNDKVGPLQYVITGGEPFIREDIFDILDRISKSNVDFSIFTNATLLNEDKIKQLKQYKPKFVAVSLDGINNETNKIIRGNDSFYTVVDNVRLLAKHGLKVRINTLLLKGINDTKEQIKSTLEFFDELGANSMVVNGITTTGRGADMAQYYLDDHTAGVLRDCFAEFNTRHLNELDRNQSFKSKYDNALNLTYCGLGVSVFMIKSNGDVVLCPTLYDNKHKVGNILKDDIVDLWNNSPIFNNIRNEPFDSSGECKECDVKQSCLGGCRATVYEKNKTFIGPDTWSCGFYDKLRKKK